MNGEGRSRSLMTTAKRDS